MQLHVSIASHHRLIQFSLFEMREETHFRHLKSRLNSKYIKWHLSSNDSPSRSLWVTQFRLVVCFSFQALSRVSCRCFLLMLISYYFNAYHNLDGPYKFVYVLDKDQVLYNGIVEVHRIQQDKIHLYKANKVHCDDAHYYDREYEERHHLIQSDDDEMAVCDVVWLNLMGSHQEEECFGPFDGYFAVVLATRMWSAQAVMSLMEQHLFDPLNVPNSRYHCHLVQC